MAIAGVSDSYSTYASYANQTEKANSVNKTKDNKKTDTLEQLKERYPSFDIATGTVNQSSISSKKGFQGVTINPAYLAKAENDEKEAQKLDEMLSGVETAQKWKEKVLGSKGLELISSGFFIDANGNMGSYSVVKSKNTMFDGIAKQAEDMNEKLKERKEEKATEQKKAEKLKEEKLLTKSEEKEFELSKDKNMKISIGNHVDFSI